MVGLKLTFKFMKVFPHYPYLPPELRMMIVDEMGPRDRCLFSSCSKLSWKEVKSSKNAIYGLELADYFWGEAMCISVSFCEKNEHFGFRLLFDVENGTHMKYQRYKGMFMWEEVWRIELDNSKNVAQFVIFYFKHLLKMYQKTIKKLEITANNENIVGTDFEIVNLKNLEKLHIGSSVDIRQFLPKIQRQLKDLNVMGIENCRIIEEWAPTYQVRDNLLLHDSNLNYSQFLRITAKDVTIPIDQLTEQDIIHFIKSWHNRSYTGPIERCFWAIKNPNFDINSIFELAQTLEGFTLKTNGVIYIKQKDSEEKAVLFCVVDIIIFTHWRHYN